MSSEVPAEWLNKRLGECLASAQGGGTPSRDNAAFWDGDIPWASVKDITNHTLRPQETITRIGLANSTSRVVSAGTNILALRMAVGSVARFALDVAINQDLVGLVPNEQLDPDFLFHWLSARSDHFRAIATGTTVKGLRKDVLLDWPIVLPPLDEQRRIAEVLRSVDESIAANRAVLLQTKAARAATLHASFEHSPWSPVRLGDLGCWKSGGTPSKADAALWEGDVPWVCPRDMKSPVITRSESSVSEAAIGKGCKIVPKGTLLMVVRGMILAKAIPTATIAMDATYNQDIKAFHPNGRTIPKFIQICLQHKENELLKLVNTATHGTKKLDARKISEIEIPLPDISTQIELSKAMTDMDLAMVKAGEEHIRLATIKSSLQTELLSGKVRVPA